MEISTNETIDYHNLQDNPYQYLPISSAVAIVEDIVEEALKKSEQNLNLLINQKNWLATALLYALTINDQKYEQLISKALKLIELIFTDKSEDSLQISIFAYTYVIQNQSSSHIDIDNSIGKLKQILPKISTPHPFICYLNCMLDVAKGKGNCHLDSFNTLIYSLLNIRFNQPIPGISNTINRIWDVKSNGEYIDIFNGFLEVLFKEFWGNSKLNENTRKIFLLFFKKLPKKEALNRTIQTTSFLDSEFLAYKLVPTETIFQLFCDTILNDAKELDMEKMLLLFQSPNIHSKWFGLINHYLINVMKTIPNEEKSDFFQRLNTLFVRRPLAMKPVIIEMFNEIKKMKAIEHIHLFFTNIQMVFPKFYASQKESFSHKLNIQPTFSLFVSSELSIFSDNTKFLQILLLYCFTIDYNIVLPYMTNTNIQPDVIMFLIQIAKIGNLTEKTKNKITSKIKEMKQPNDYDFNLLIKILLLTIASKEHNLIQNVSDYFDFENSKDVVHFALPSAIISFAKSKQGKFLLIINTCIGTSIYEINEFENMDNQSLWEKTLKFLVGLGFILPDNRYDLKVVQQEPLSLKKFFTKTKTPKFYVSTAFIGSESTSLFPENDANQSQPSNAFKKFLYNLGEVVKVNKNNNVPKIVFRMNFIDIYYKSYYYYDDDSKRKFIKNNDMLIIFNDTKQNINFSKLRIDSVLVYMVSQYTDGFYVISLIKSPPEISALEEKEEMIVKEEHLKYALFSFIFAFAKKNVSYLLRGFKERQNAIDDINTSIGEQIF